MHSFSHGKSTFSSAYYFELQYNFTKYGPYAFLHHFSGVLFQVRFYEFYKEVTIFFLNLVWQIRESKSIACIVIVLHRDNNLLSLKHAQLGSCDLLKVLCSSLQNLLVKLTFSTFYYTGVTISITALLNILCIYVCTIFVYSVTCRASVRTTRLSGRRMWTMAHCKTTATKH